MIKGEGVGAKDKDVLEFVASCQQTRAPLYLVMK